MIPGETIYPKSLNRRTRRMGFVGSVEIDCGKTNATAATIIRRSHAAIPMRTEVHRVTAAHPGIWSSIGADTETSKAASKLKPSPQFRCWHQHQLGRLTPDSIGGKDYNTRKTSGTIQSHEEESLLSMDRLWNLRESRTLACQPSSPEAIMNFRLRRGFSPLRRIFRGGLAVTIVIALLASPLSGQ